MALASLHDDAQQALELEEEEASRRHLVFGIERGLFALPISVVTEIIGLLPITVVPHPNPHVKGIINLRGRIIPIVDVRVRFGLDERPYHERTCIVVVECRDEPVGLVVDTVQEVVDLVDDDVRDTPPVGRSAHNPFIRGISNQGDKVRQLIDLEALLYA